MNHFNLSEWAIRHRSLVTYFMLIIFVAGIGFLLPARAERGSGLHRQDHGGPGRMAGRQSRDTLEQITDRLERKLQETPNLDYLKDYTTAGQATIFVYLKDSTPRPRCRTSGTRSARRSAISATPCRQASSSPASMTSSAIPTA